LAKILYLDCFSGASGDMVLGACLDAGVPLDAVRAALGSLGLDDYAVSSEKVLRSGIAATRWVLDERVPAGSVAAQESGAHAEAHAHPHRHVAQIERLIARSALHDASRDRAIALVRRLASIEADIHQMPIEQVHLHEVGALDSIIDIVGVAFAMEWAGADRIVSSPVNVGGGMVHSAHGLFPVPAPATVKLLGDAPVYSSGLQQELVTPTGALIVSTYAGSFGAIPAMSIERVGYGAGDRDDPTTPNVLRVFVGRAADQPSAGRVSVVECEIDDMNPQLFGPLMDRLYGAGALDVYYAAVQMKKNRPGTLVTIIAPPDRRDALAGILFTDTTTIGVRHREMRRERLERTIRTIDTPVGSIRFKIASRDGLIVNASPEFDDCVKAASERGLSIKEVQARAVKAWIDREG
jgi:pyridinium-3,5-bisthiocarboxylic acid mononucleotide nickel chelatase